MSAGPSPAVTVAIWPSGIAVSAPAGRSAADHERKPLEVGDPRARLGREPDA